MQIIEISQFARYFLMFLMTILIAGPGTASDNVRALEAATLDYPPYEYLENDKPKGIAVELITEAASRAGLKSINFSFFPWKRAVLMAKTGQSDILFNAGKNRERQEWGLYAESTLILQKYVFFKRKESNVTINPNLNNVQDHVIAIRLGYLYGSDTFRKAIDTDKFKSVILSKSTEQSVALLLSKKIDIFVGDYLPVMHFLKENALLNEVDIVKDPVTTDNMIVLSWPTYVLFSKTTVRKEYVNEFSSALEQMKQDGTYQRIYSRYVDFLEDSN